MKKANSLIVPLLVPIPSALSTTVSTTLATTVTASRATIALMLVIPVAIACLFVPSLPPVTRIITTSILVSLVIVSGTAATGSLFSTVFIMGVWTISPYASAIDVLDLLVAVLLLAFDLETFALPLGWRLEREKTLLRFFSIEFYEYTTFEPFVRITP